MIEFFAKKAIFMGGSASEFRDCLSTIIENYDQTRDDEYKALLKENKQHILSDNSTRLLNKIFNDDKKQIIGFFLMRVGLDNNQFQEFLKIESLKNIEKLSMEIKIY